MYYPCHWMAFLNLVNFMEVDQMENQTWQIRLFACGKTSRGIDHITIWQYIIVEAKTMRSSEMVVNLNTILKTLHVQGPRKFHPENLHSESCLHCCNGENTKIMCHLCHFQKKKLELNILISSSNFHFSSSFDFILPRKTCRPSEESSEPVCPNY